MCLPKLNTMLPCGSSICLTSAYQLSKFNFVVDGSFGTGNHMIYVLCIFKISFGLLLYSPMLQREVSLLSSKSDHEDRDTCLECS